MYLFKVVVQVREWLSTFATQIPQPLNSLCLTSAHLSFGKHNRSSKATMLLNNTQHVIFKFNANMFHTIIYLHKPTGVSL